jgi:hypothetical protein
LKEYYDMMIAFGDDDIKKKWCIVGWKCGFNIEVGLGRVWSMVYNNVDP